MLTHPLIKVIVAIWYILYIAISYYGLKFIKEGLEPIHLVPDDSFAIEYYNMVESYFWSYGPEVQIVVSSPPSFYGPFVSSDPSINVVPYNGTEITNPYSFLNASWAIIDHFTNSYYTLGRDGVSVYLKDFEQYLDNTGTLGNVDYYPSLYPQLLKRFLNLGANSRWRVDVKLSTNSAGLPDLGAFRFTIGMKNSRTQQSQMYACQSLRALAAELPAYNISTMWVYWGFMDQYALVVPNSIQNVLIALLAMLVVSILLISHLVCAFCVAISILSIAFGVTGVLTMWSVDFDVITMIIMTMSVGFSVDFSAHISHGYVTSQPGNSNRRMCETLGRLGPSIIQGAASTVLGVMVLWQIDAYVVQAFFKSVFAVILFGTLHALVFLPVLLTLVVRKETNKNCGCCKH